MSSRYNPHSIEKQARKWPASLFSGEQYFDLKSDLLFRQRQIWALEPDNLWKDPFKAIIQIDPDLISEYGIDAARIAQITAQNREITINLLESAFKWLSRFDNCFFNNDLTKVNFDSAVWLEALLQANETIFACDYVYGGLALIKKARKLSPPTANLDNNQLLLVTTAIYPYCPIYSRYKAVSEVYPPATCFQLIKLYKEYACIRFSVKKNIWHWKVFPREVFESSPIEALRQIVWVDKMLQNKKIELNTTMEGIQICFQ